MKMNGKAPGSSIDVGSEIELADGPDGSTDLIWKADVSIVGSIASLAARLDEACDREDDGPVLLLREEENRGMKFGPVPLSEAEGKILRAQRRRTRRQAAPPQRQASPLRKTSTCCASSGRTSKSTLPSSSLKTSTRTPPPTESRSPAREAGFDSRVPPPGA